MKNLRFSFPPRKLLNLFLLMALLFSAVGFATPVFAAAGDDAELTDQSGNPTVEPGQRFFVRFVLKNIGTTSWTPGHHWLQNQRKTLGANPVQPLSSEVPPGGIATWSVELLAPKALGVYRTDWILSHDGTTFGPLLSVEVTVKHLNVDVNMAGVLQGSYGVDPNLTLFAGYGAITGGPLIVQSRGGIPIIASLRGLWSDGTTQTSYKQMMGLPATLLSTKYVFPLYDNVTMNDQLRIANVGTAQTQVKVTIAGAVRGSYILQPNQVRVVRYPGLVGGAVVVQGSAGVPIVASLRDIWSSGISLSSYSEMIGLPASQLTTKYVFPMYDNVTMNEQLRVANVGTVKTRVTVTIGGIVKGSFVVKPNQVRQVRYPGLAAAAVVVQSSAGVPIVASLRDIWTDGGVLTSYSEMIGFPASQLTTRYVFPSYNNVELNDQLRITNLGTAKTVVTITVGGVVKGSYAVKPNQVRQVRYPGLSGGPVVVQSSAGIPIIVSLRELWSNGTALTSFAQMMGLPANRLSDRYVFPLYDSVELDEQLRIALP